ncbi:MAG: transposase [Caldilineaceae bacterium SB0666_bin_21]|nr:transposase [Caldilineaceae bacterium SB0666_bin_21]
MPDAIVPLLSPFESLFDVRTWRKVQILLPGVILAPGRRTVSSALYVLGLQARGDFARYHHVLSRASWSSLAVSRVLLEQLVSWSSTWSRRDRCNWPSMRPWNGVGGPRSTPWGCIGTRSAPPTATSSRPRGCAGSA